MGIAVIGGLVFGSLLTLFVIPAMYVLLHRTIVRTESTPCPSPAPGH